MLTFCLTGPLEQQNLNHNTKVFHEGKWKCDLQNNGHMFLSIYALKTALKGSDLGLWTTNYPVLEGAQQLWQKHNLFEMQM